VNLDKSKDGGTRVSQRDKIELAISKGMYTHPGVVPDIHIVTTCDGCEKRRYGQTETEYKDWAVECLRRQYTTTVPYFGDNDITYNKECRPNFLDILIQSIGLVYVLEVRQTMDLQFYSYPFEYFAAGPSRVTVEDDNLPLFAVRKKWIG